MLQWGVQKAAHQAPASLGFSRQEHWSELSFPSPMHESEELLVRMNVPHSVDYLNLNAMGFIKVSDHTIVIIWVVKPLTVWITINCGEF